MCVLGMLRCCHRFAANAGDGAGVGVTNDEGVRFGFAVSADAAVIVGE